MPASVRKAFLVFIAVAALKQGSFGIENKNTACMDLPEGEQSFTLLSMHEAKNTARALVRIGYDGRVHKYFKGPQAQERYENEKQVLFFLQKKECPFVPRILQQDDAQLYLVTSNAGQRVEHVSSDKCKRLFAELESYGVRHEDAEVRNITYNERAGRFCIIDFEFATILESGYQPSPLMESHPNRDAYSHD